MGSVTLYKAVQSVQGEGWFADEYRTDFPHFIDRLIWNL